MIWALWLVACGGSASESPWPPEPSDVDLGPAGEEELSKPARKGADGKPAESASPVSPSGKAP